MNYDDFNSTFKHLTGHSPFPWQQKIYTEWATGSFNAAGLSLPTGVGKTSVIAIWAILRAEGAPVPRRLVYVVNRRTVVDQTTDEVEKIARNLLNSPLNQKLRDQCALDVPDSESALAISTLRGQMADNRAWSADPCRPAVIVGTVDMIGSRLLFGGYRIGFKSRPLHAAFLGQDTLVIHDEAHLEPAFQKLLEAIQEEQSREQSKGQPQLVPAIKIVQLSATTRSSQSAEEPFRLTDADKLDPVLSRRLCAKKRLHFHEMEDVKALPGKIAELALQHKDSKAPILIFVRELATLTKTKTELEKLIKSDGKGFEVAIRTLNGAMRGRERDSLVADKAFKRFIPNTQTDHGGTTYLICTSAGEVGVNLSAKHMVCDLSTFESMAQRFGRVNRFGDSSLLPESEQTRIDIVHEEKFELGKSESVKEYQHARSKTLELLKRLNGDASPNSLSALNTKDTFSAFSPEPKILQATDILFDNWAMTSIRDTMPGRPPIEPYLHGVNEEFDPPRTSIAWRQEVEKVSGELLSRYSAESLLEDYPLKPIEILTDRSDRIHKELKAIHDRLRKTDSEHNQNEAESPIWIVGNNGIVSVQSLSYIAENKDLIEGQTLLLPPKICGLNEAGMLDAKATLKLEPKLDIADQWPDQAFPKRIRQDGDVKPPAFWRMIREIDLGALDDGATERQIWRWFEAPWGGDAENLTGAPEPVLVKQHNSDVEAIAETFGSKLSLSDGLRKVLKIAANGHDLGKNRILWQRSIGNPNAEDPDQHLAKSSPSMKPKQLSEYRHEFGSLIDVLKTAEHETLDEHELDLVLHIIASHHGRARPHFTASEIIDPDSGLIAARKIAKEIPHRYARLQLHYGRWGLAWIESILRAADYAASGGRTTIINPQNSTL